MAEKVGKCSFMGSRDLCYNREAKKEVRKKDENISI
jgi:hypothetical protein